MTSLLKSILGGHHSGNVHKSPSFSDLSMGASDDGALVFACTIRVLRAQCMGIVHSV
jgi:hypothetical protein